MIENKPEIQSGFEKMADIFSYDGNIYSELSAALDIVSEFYDIYRPQNEKTSKRSGKILSEKVRTYIEQNYADSIKIKDIAADNFISEGYLSHAFKAETGMSPREYLTHIRCTRACELIRYTGMKLSDIAANTGFCSQSDMSRKIRENYGVTRLKSDLDKIMVIAQKQLAVLSHSKTDQNAASPVQKAQNIIYTAKSLVRPEI